MFGQYHYLEFMKGVILFVVLTALCSVAASAQNLTELLRLASSHNISNPDSAVYWSDRTLSAFTEKDADTLRLQALFYKGWNLSLLGRFDEAIPVFRTMLTEYQRYNYRLEVIRATGRIGTCYRELIQYDSALFYLHQYDSLVDLHLGLNIIEAKIEIGELFRVMDRTDL